MCFVHIQYIRRIRATRFTMFMKCTKCSWFTIINSWLKSMAWNGRAGWRSNRHIYTKCENYDVASRILARLRLAFDHRCLWMCGWFVRWFSLKVRVQYNTIRTNCENCRCERARAHHITQQKRDAEGLTTNMCVPLHIAHDILLCFFFFFVWCRLFSNFILNLAEEIQKNKNRNYIGESGEKRAHSFVPHGWYIRIWLCANHHHVGPYGNRFKANPYLIIYIFFSFQSILYWFFLLVRELGRLRCLDCCCSNFYVPRYHLLDERCYTCVYIYCLCMLDSYTTETIG